MMMAVAYVGFLLLMVWLDGWWPDRLIPWIPFERT